MAERANDFEREGRIYAPTDDRVLPETRLVSCVIPLFLVVAFAMLYFFPDNGVSLNGSQLFAWVINPPITPMVMGGGYISGVYFFTRLVMGGRWHWFTHGFPAITAFTWFMGLSTFLHWDRFLHDSISFYAWLLLYVVTPFLVPVLWLRNRSADPGTPDPEDAVVPSSVRAFVRVIGVAMVALAVFMFVFPDLMIPLWPWKLTPLTTRVIGGWFALPGVMALFASGDPRWSSWKVLMESQVIGFVLILVGVVRAWGNFNAASPMTWLFVGSLVALLLGIVALYGAMEGRRSAAAPIA